jgi:uncharacterized protein (DUF2147 family)
MRMLVFLFFLCTAQTGLAQSGIFGQWINEEKNCVIEIYTRHQKAYGKIIWLRDSVDVFGEIRRDVHNEKASLRSRKLSGIDVFMNLQFDGSRKWADGQIYHIESGNTYNLSIRLMADGRLRAKGYWWWFSFLGRSEYWSRYDEP